MADALTRAQLTELKEVFDYFDHDKKGRLNAAALSKIFQGFGANLTDFELQDMIAEIDIGEHGGTGTLDFPEFATLMTREYVTDEGGAEDAGVEAELRALFAELCKGEDGKKHLLLGKEALQKSFEKAGFKFHLRFVEDMIKEVASTRASFSKRPARDASGLSSAHDNTPNSSSEHERLVDIKRATAWQCRHCGKTLHYVSILRTPGAPAVGEICDHLLNMCFAFYDQHKTVIEGLRARRPEKTLGLEAVDTLDHCKMKSEIEAACVDVKESHAKWKMMHMPDIAWLKNNAEMNRSRKSRATTAKPLNQTRQVKGKKSDSRAKASTTNRVSSITVADFLKVMGPAEKQ
uniref:Calmodulin n=2 Tax=Lotharella globosa TaxID=91324 RepID=A0A7S3YI28_9EUKA